MPSQTATFEHFEIARRPDGSLHELGRGAMGVTYKAFDTRLGSHVALKVITADAIKSEIGRVRFEREAKAAAHLNHPNVAAIFHRGQDGDAYFYAMQFIEGETFDAFVKRRGPLPAALALRLILQAAQGLAAASNRGLIHRDIKPANLMLVHPEADAGAPGQPSEPDDEDLLVKVIDFGLAKYLNKPGDTTDISLTGDRIVGTPHYMSPEQIDPVGKEIDARADIYSLGVTLWHLLSGKPPFRGTEFQVFNQHMTGSLPWEQLPPGVPPPVFDLLERMLAKDPANRPANHRELIGLIKQLLRALDVRAAGGSMDGLPAQSRAGQVPLQDVVEQLPDQPARLADFSLADVLACRARLTTGEAFGLLSLLAPVVDAKRADGGQGYDLTPARIFVRFDSSPERPDELCAQPLDLWPPSQLEIVPLAENAASSPMDARPARPLGELAYTLLTGQPPGGTYQPVPGLNARGNAVLRHVLEASDSFDTATRFAAAFRLTLAGELHVPTAPVATNGGIESTGWDSDIRDYSPEGFRRAGSLRKARRFPGVRGLAVVGVVVVAAGGWWWHAGGRAPGLPTALAGWFRPSPAAVPTPEATVAPAPAPAQPVDGNVIPGSITTRAVRRYAPPPFFPPAAKAAHQQGTVLLTVDVDATGAVTAVSVKRGSGFPLLDEAAMQAMRVWKFEPARTNQVAVASRTEQPVEFKTPGQ